MCFNAKRPDLQCSPVFYRHILSFMFFLFLQYLYGTFKYVVILVHNLIKF